MLVWLPPDMVCQTTACRERTVAKSASSSRAALPAQEHMAANSRGLSLRKGIISESNICIDTRKGI